jgi:DNA primase
VKSKYLIVEVEITLAFDEDAAGRRVEILQRIDQAQAEGLLQA